MAVKTLYVYFSNDCLPYKDKERTVHFPVVGSSFVGVSKTTKIRFYVDQITNDSSAVWLAVSKLPNGQIGYTKLEQATDSDGIYVELQLTTWHTQFQGNLFINLQAYDGGVEFEEDEDTGLLIPQGVPVVYVSGSIKLAINYATGLIDSDAADIHTLQELFAWVSTYVKKDANEYIKVCPIGQINTDSSWNDYLRQGDIVFDIRHHKFYKITEDTPDYEYELIDIEFDDIAVNGNAIFNEEVRVVNGASYLTFGENGLTSLQDYLDEKQDQIPYYEISPTHSGTITQSAILNSLAKFPSFLFYTYNGETFYYLHSGTDSTNYYFRKQFKQSVVSNATNLIYGGDVYIAVNKTTGVYSQTGTQYNFYSKDQVDSIVSTLKANAYQVVATLPSTGEQGIIYLVETSTNVYEQYIWESGAYIDLGSTSIDLSGYVQKTQTIAGIALSGNISASDLANAINDELNATNETTDVNYIMGVE